MVEFDIAIIGGGTGGYTAAIRAAQMGACVCLIENDKLGGTCLHRGCIPTKALYSTARLLGVLKEGELHGVYVESMRFDAVRALQRKDAVVKKLETGIEKLLLANKVEVFRGTAFLEDSKRLRIRQGAVTGHIKARNIILATGSRPIILNDFPVDRKDILTSDEFLVMENFPQSLLIIGGGYIGCELAGIAAAFGCKVTLVEKMPDLLGGSDRQAVKEVERELKERRVDIYKNTAAAAPEIIDGGVRVKLVGRDQTIIIEAEKVLCALGRIPNVDNLGLEGAGVRLNKRAIEVDSHMRTSVENIFAIGDVTDIIQLAHVASYQGEVAVQNALGGDIQTDYQVMPLAIFTFPEIGQVGWNEQQCRDSGREYRTGRFSYQASGKALCDGKERGLVKIFADKKDGSILGGSVYGEEASTLISEIAVAMRTGTSVSELGEVVHAHPTLPEIVKEAADDAMGRGIHKVGLKSRKR